VPLPAIVRAFLADASLPGDLVLSPETRDHHREGH
jgi:hypothetical protein